ncbi:MAG: alpha/beta fold hydrolase, partial [Rhodothermales bacterium]|nr:alpha/beta fold hydrolase [Rhodothermales bacterium]
MNPIRTRYLDVGGVRVYCRYSDGDGPAVVLLPGGMLDTSTLTWRYTLDALPPRWRVFAPDLPGYGRSAKPDVSYSTAYYVDFLAAFLDALGLRRAHLCGSSMTGAVVLGLALRAPERAASVVLSGAYGMQPRVPLHPLVYLLAHVPGLPVLTRAVLRGGPRVMRLALRFAVPDPRAIGSDLVRDACEGVAHDGQ